jgi:glycosyltransferase involved in cell wall biosynthesis
LRNLRLKVYAFLEKICMLRAQMVVGVSNDIVNGLKRRGIPDKKLTLIHNGIDLDEFRNTEKKITDKNVHNIFKDIHSSFVIGSLGRLTEQKNYITLIQAAAEFLKEDNSVDFIIAGEGPLETDLFLKTKELGIDRKFHFIGYQRDVSYILKKLDIFVLTSLDEGLPMALLEAMAARKPVVTTPVGEIGKVITNGLNGMIFQKKEYRKLKDILMHLKNDSDEREQLANNAYNLVNTNYSNEKMTDMYIDLYNKIVLDSSDSL